MFLLLVTVLTIVIFIFLFQKSHELIDWLIFLGVSIRVTRYDINYEISVAFP